MLKKLLKVANHLDDLGLTAEADALDGIISKIAGPLIGHHPLDPNEPRGYPVEYDDAGEEIRRDPIREIKRRKSILRDKRERERLKYQMSRSRLPIEEQEEAEVDRWYDSVKNLGDNIILIPFDKEEVDKNDEILEGMAAIFGMGYARNYLDLYNRANMQSGSSSYNSGNLEVLKEVFPALWSDIQGTLSAKGLDEGDAVYMFYNQDNSPVRSLFTKDPEYFGHDMGHNVFDTESYDSTFKDILKDFLQDLLKLYVTDSGKAVSEKFLDSIYNDSGSGEYLCDIFGNPSGPEDIYGDVFGQAAAGNLDFNSENVPKSFWIKGEDYNLLPEKAQEASSLLEGCIKQLNDYVNPNHQYGTYAPGPLAEFAGSVVLNDV